SEGQQPGVAQQQVEGAGEQRIAHDLHDEDRVAAQRRQRGQQDQGGQIGDQLSIHDSFPNSPAGRVSSTITMMMNTTVLEASGQKTLVKPSMMPRPRPVTIEPRIEPMPPMTTTAKTTMIRFEPISGETCRMGRPAPRQSPPARRRSR